VIWWQQILISFGIMIGTIAVLIAFFVLLIWAVGKVS